MKLKTYRVSLDRPGAGWDCEVKATCGREAMLLANKLHPTEGLADTCFEVPFVGDALHNYTVAAKNYKKAAEHAAKIRKEFADASDAEYEAGRAYAKARAVYNMSKELS